MLLFFLKKLHHSVSFVKTQKGKLDTRHVTECTQNSGWPLFSCHWRLVKVSRPTSCARCQRPLAGSHPPETPAETHKRQPENMQH